MSPRIIYLPGNLDCPLCGKRVAGDVLVSPFRARIATVDSPHRLPVSSTSHLRVFGSGSKLAPTTVHKRLQVARSFFLAMKRRRLIEPTRSTM